MYKKGGGMSGCLRCTKERCTVEAWLLICLLATDQECLSMPGLWLE